MSPFWSGFFDQLKDCGKNATLFLAIMATLVGVAVLSVVLAGKSFAPEITPALPGIAFLAVLRVWCVIRRDRLARRQRLSFPRLSDDELRVARSRLTRNQNAKG